MTTGHLDRRELLATIAGTGVASLGVTGGTLAAWTDLESTSGSLTTGTWQVGIRRVAYTTSGALETAVQSGTTSYSISNVGVLGPVEPGFDGADYHMPVVDGSSNIVLVEPDGTENTLSIGSSYTPLGSKSLIATGRWNGHPESVYYAGDSASYLYRIAPGGSVKQVSQPSNGVKAALGPGDINDDGVVEFAFVDGSAKVRYIVPSTDSTTRDIKSTGKTPGSNNNYGVGSPLDIAGYGGVIPAVNGSGGLGLLDASGWAEKSLTSGSTAKKCPVYGCDFDDDGNIEIVFVGYSNGYLKYLDDVGGTNDIVRIEDSSGNPITADDARGVR